MKKIPFMAAVFTIFSCRAVTVRYSKGSSEEKSSAEACEEDYDARKIAEEPLLAGIVEN